MAKKKTIYIILVGLLILILILVFGRGKEGGEEEEIIDHKIVGEYSDNVCKVKFGYPKSWTKSSLVLPLPQEPLSQATFDEPGKNSIFFYICYNARSYSFSQFLKINPFSSGGIEELNVGGIKWQRVGNFIYTTQNNKLIIFEMFFTKYDLKPEPEYEETFLNIIKSVQF
ncbi:MAG: hypothetical protein Q8P74_00835 [bacterium]|nr:hypothetical protein [bacterium]